MDNEIYRVERDEYAGVVGQINTSHAKADVYENDGWTIIKIVGSDGVHLTSRMIGADGEEVYYVFNLPCDEDRLPPKKIRKINLETREEVEEFFKILGQIQKREQENG